MNDIVIARYEENLDWVVKIPTEFKVHIYNKGAEIKTLEVIRRAANILNRNNVGREAESYLWHMQHHLGRDNYTVFCQGDPFEHSPDFINLLNECHLWQGVQPLSWQWRHDENIPPAAVLNNYNGKMRDGPRIRAEYFSLMTWNPLHFYDAGAFNIGNNYREIHRLEEGTNIAAHFLNKCKLANIAKEASLNLVGKFSYGGQFAVNNELVRALPNQSLALLHKATMSHPAYGYVLERLWLHLFGMPFCLSQQTDPETEVTYAAQNVPEEIVFVPHLTNTSVFVAAARAAVRLIHAAIANIGHSK